jgi:hypothetical protein
MDSLRALLRHYTAMRFQDLFPQGSAWQQRFESPVNSPV